MAITTAMASSFKQQLLQGMHSFTLGSTFTADTTNTSAALANVSSIANLIPGMAVSGTGIPASTVIASIDSATGITLSKAATATNSTVTVTFGSGDAFKIALYTSAATLGAATTAYSATNEVSGTGYTAAGGALVNVTPTLSSTTALTDFADFTWSTATITARGALIYNTRSAANRAVTTHDFGSDKTSTAGDFTVVFPVADASNAIIRVA